MNDIYLGLLSEDKESLSRYRKLLDDIYDYSLVCLVANGNYTNYMKELKHFSSIEEKQRRFKYIIERDRRKDKLSRHDDKISIGGFFSPIRGSDGNFLVDRMTGSLVNRMEVHSRYFVNKYELISHINEDMDSSGFCAVLLRNIQTGELVLGLSGTKFPFNLSVFSELDWQDILADISIALKKLPFKQFRSMIDFYISSGVVDKISVVGHSLGGYLAQIFSLSFPEMISSIYTFQAPGAKDFWIDNISYLRAKKFRVKEELDAFLNLGKGIRYDSMRRIGGLVHHIHSTSNFDRKEPRWVDGNFVQCLGRKTDGQRVYVELGNRNYHFPAVFALGVYDYRDGVS